MPKHNKTGRSKVVPGGYVRLDGYMLDSEAWKSLSPYARAVYIALKRRFRNRGKGKDQQRLYQHVTTRGGGSDGM